MDDKERCGALWTRTSAKGTEYLGGVIDGTKVLIFKNRKKGERDPDYSVFRAAAPATPPAPAPAPPMPPATTPPVDDIPW